MYSPREIARATGVPEARVRAATPRGAESLTHREAVALGRRLITAQPTGTRSIFSVFDATTSHRSGLPFALSSTVHAGVFAAIVLVFTFSPAPVTTTLATIDRPSEPMRLVYLSIPGPGGGGGGGGLLQKAPPPKAMREGPKKISSPIPKREPPKPIEPVPTPPEPKPPPPLKAESLPVVVAPIVTAPADNRDRAGVLEQARVETDSRGPGQGGGVGIGRGTGLGEGDGSGVGPGSGGGTGGGPFRPGSGINPPRLLQEVKADYTEEARRASIT